MLPSYLYIINYFQNYTPLYCYASHLHLNQSTTLGYRTWLLMHLETLYRLVTSPINRFEHY